MKLIGSRQIYRATTINAQQYFDAFNSYYFYSNSDIASLIKIKPNKFYRLHSIDYTIISDYSIPTAPSQDEYDFLKYSPILNIGLTNKTKYEDFEDKLNITQPYSTNLITYSYAFNELEISDSLESRKNIIIYNRGLASVPSNSLAIYNPIYNLSDVKLKSLPLSSSTYAHLAGFFISNARSNIQSPSKISQNIHINSQQYSYLILSHSYQLRPVYVTIGNDSLSPRDRTINYSFSAILDEYEP